MPRILNSVNVIFSKKKICGMMEFIYLHYFEAKIN